MKQKTKERSRAKLCFRIKESNGEYTISYTQRKYGWGMFWSAFLALGFLVAFLALTTGWISFWGGMAFTAFFVGLCMLYINWKRSRPVHFTLNESGISTRTKAYPWKQISRIYIEQLTAGGGIAPELTTYHLQSSSSYKTAPVNATVGAANLASGTLYLLQGISFRLQNKVGKEQNELDYRINLDSGNRSVILAKGLDAHNASLLHQQIHELANRNIPSV